MIMRCDMFQMCLSWLFLIEAAPPAPLTPPLDHQSIILDTDTDDQIIETTTKNDNEHYQDDITLSKTLENIESNAALRTSHVQLEDTESDAPVMSGKERKSLISHLTDLQLQSGIY